MGYAKRLQYRNIYQRGYLYFSAIFKSNPARIKQCI